LFEMQFRRFLLQAKAPGRNLTGLAGYGSPL
jgi:hypothetical protein